jgi:1-phosphofructokinase
MAPLIAPTTDGAAPRVCVFAPLPLLTVAIETMGGRPGDEVHLHAGGQGFWIARLVSELGARVVLCTTCGGETGRVLRSLFEDEELELRCVDASTANGAYVDDRRSGERERIAEMEAAPLSRHEVDELYGTTLVEALEADLTVLGGPGEREDLLPSDFYRRITADLVANDRVVAVDLSGEPLRAAVAGGATIVKLSHEALVNDGYAKDDSFSALVAGMAKLGANGQEAVVCSRAEEPALAWFDERLVEIRGPVLDPIDHRGAGDSFTAGMATALAGGREFDHALRLGAAAGVLNVTRRGLGTGARDEIERLASHVEIRDLDPTGGDR